MTDIAIASLLGTLTVVAVAIYYGVDYLAWVGGKMGWAASRRSKMLIFLVPATLLPVFLGVTADYGVPFSNWLAALAALPAVTAILILGGRDDEG